ncbi:DnaB-like helicase N-terminal domain-containing protein [Solihabitans fulvus]|uniref:DnaB-like helicase N-terminal domain-containing protein n=1 Tax=Solihabitans fulvus TaxID=1892852 RepID=UPI001661F340|nr:DnaB-like helicase N-terminal domain-containing protein [Solihabitans fulvus]
MSLAPHVLAERALLGCLLWDPRRVMDVWGWLDADDFAFGTHRGVYGTLVGALRQDPGAAAARTSEHVISPNATLPELVLALPDLLQAGTYTDVRHNLLHAVHLHTLMAAVPAGASQHVRYGQMVQEASIRRQVLAWGVRMDQAAISVPTAEGSPEAITEAAEALADWLAELNTRVEVAHGHVHGLARPVEQPSPALRASARLPNPAALPSSETVERAARRVIHAAIVFPNLRKELVERLCPEDFPTTQTTNAWRVVMKVHCERFSPVDYVTVMWEQQRGEPTCGPGLSAEQLAVMIDAPVGGTQQALCTVVQSAIVRLVGRANTSVAQTATNAAVGVPDLLHTTGQIYDAVDHHARRLTGTTNGHISGATPRIPQSRRRRVQG